MELLELLVDEEKSIIEAMDLINKNSKRILFVNKDKKLVASVTDGDIRRWILKKGSLDAKVKDIANYEPFYLEENKENMAKEFMNNNFIDAIPIVNKQMEILSVVFLKEESTAQRKELKVPVVIMAGGFGTRLYPYTKILPKPLIPIGEIPIVEHIINRFNKYGSTNFYLILNHKKNMIKAYFNEIEKAYNVHYIDENKPLGTGGGLSLLKDKINTTFILSNCDILVEEDYQKIYEHHKNQNNLITMVCSVKNIKIPYGVIEINENGEIDSMKEKPEISFFTNTGFYIVEPKVIRDSEEDKIIGFPDIIEQYRSQGEKIGVYPISENRWLDMGQLDELEEMRRRLERDE